MGKKKSVSDLILDKFAETTQADASLKGISNDLTKLVRQGKPGKTEIEHLFRRKENEDPKS